jgi:hypothetical protein
MARYQLTAAILAQLGPRYSCGHSTAGTRVQQRHLHSAILAQLCNPSKAGTRVQQQHLHIAILAQLRPEQNSDLGQLRHWFSVTLTQLRHWFSLTLAQK